MSKAIAKLNHYPVSPLKVKRSVDLIRGKEVNKAIEILSFSKLASSKAVLKLLKSAIANAAQAQDATKDPYYITSAYVNEGVTLKRIRPRAQGRAYRIRKRSSHIFLEISNNAKETN